MLTTAGITCFNTGAKVVSLAALISGGMRGRQSVGRLMGLSNRGDQGAYQRGDHD